MSALDWVSIGMILGPVTAFLIHRALTGRRPSAAEVATAQQIAATPAHPAGRGLGGPRDGRPLNEDEQKRLDKVACDSWPFPPVRRVPQQRRPQ